MTKNERHDLLSELSLIQYQVEEIDSAQLGIEDALGHIRDNIKNLSSKIERASRDKE
jgi:hypothetical protein